MLWKFLSLFFPTFQHLGLLLTFFWSFKHSVSSPSCHINCTGLETSTLPSLYCYLNIFWLFFHLPLLSALLLSFTDSFLLHIFSFSVTYVLSLSLSSGGTVMLTTTTSLALENLFLFLPPSSSGAFCGHSSEASNSLPSCDPLAFAFSIVLLQYFLFLSCLGIYNSYTLTFNSSDISH